MHLILQKPKQIFLDKFLKSTTVLATSPCDKNTATINYDFKIKIDSEDDTLYMISANSPQPDLTSMLITWKEKYNDLYYRYQKISKENAALKEEDVEVEEGLVPETKKKEEEFEVEDILAHKIEHNKKRRFLIKWKNYGPKHNSWADECHLNCGMILAKYLKSKNLK